MTAAFGVSGPRSLRDDATDIWSAGLAAVDSARLVESAVRAEGATLHICDTAVTLAADARIAVVGGGKAGEGMAAGFQRAVGDELLPRVGGWVNIPGNWPRTLGRFHLHPARPVGVNEPRPIGVAGTEKILQIVADLRPSDVCIVLLSGGGSALLPAPAEGITLADKQAVTRFLSRAGATIQELNCVRKQLSRIKGGRLAAACHAGTLIALIISDVIGDPLESIASGPTAPSSETAEDALAVLRQFDPDRQDVPEAVYGVLQRARDASTSADATARVLNYVIGNNRMAVEAAAARARDLGYDVAATAFDQTGVAREEGVAFAERCRRIQAALRPGDAPQCLISGGEPIVRLEPSERPQQGGRNQEFALAALEHFWPEVPFGFCILSAGTDGEDGPTDAAGAVIDSQLAERARELGMAPEPFLSDHNAYPFFEATGGLLKTGPTQTNVMDVRVGLIAPNEASPTV